VCVLECGDWVPRHVQVSLHFELKKIPNNKSIASFLSQTTMAQFIGLDQIDWGGNPGKCYECWKCQPCCGDGLFGALKCLGLWWCCGICSASKLFASSVGQQCSVWPHCLLTWCCPLCAGVAIRNNIRRRSGAPGHIVGDLVCTCCCGYCSFCQVLRAVQVPEWSIADGCQLNMIGPEVKFLN